MSAAYMERRAPARCWGISGSGAAQLGRHAWRASPSDMPVHALASSNALSHSRISRHCLLMPAGKRMAQYQGVRRQVAEACPAPGIPAPHPECATGSPAGPVLCGQDTARRLKGAADRGRYKGSAACVLAPAPLRPPLCSCGCTACCLALLPGTVDCSSWEAGRPGTHCACTPAECWTWLLLRPARGSAERDQPSSCTLCLSLRPLPASLLRRPDLRVSSGRLLGCCWQCVRSQVCAPAVF